MIDVFLFFDKESYSSFLKVVKGLNWGEVVDTLEIPHDENYWVKVKPNYNNHMGELAQKLGAQQSRVTAQLMPNLEALIRLYQKVSMVGDTLTIQLNPVAWGGNIYTEDNLIRIKPEFLAKIKADVLYYCGIEVDSNEALKVVSQATIQPNGNIFLEYTLKE